MTPGEFDPDEPAPSDTTGGGVTTGLSAVTALALLASGAVIRANELLSMADATGHISIPVDSTAIRRLRYSIRTGTMGVFFQDGDFYDYPSVSIGQFTQFVNAPSKGQFYNRFVRGQWG